ncbi:MAG: glycosyltransferase family 1 protein, partial [Cyanobacteria bacterium NC_groundwater_1444_Ag_S-0.65um_54_12]|nr:glycosyltransferase family 1 protein [Cyanobacteria bacterium NC_groundwater_1444_Ag_S-0.65um_54_12]
FNGTLSGDLDRKIKNFAGMKIWHVNDYFWNEPGSIINQKLLNYGIDYLMGYSSHDKHCSYFQKTFPRYLGKVIPVAFGFSARCEEQSAFEERKNKAIALGSVNPLRPLQYALHNYRESADFFPDETWFHKFRRMLVLNKESLSDALDSMLPEFPQIKDFSYDIVAKFNEYRMFVTCESLFLFPSAKAYEGPACGSVQICADHPCNHEFGFRDGVNAIMYPLFDVAAMAERIRYYQNHPEQLQKIKHAGTAFVKRNYSHQAVAARIARQVEAAWSGQDFRGPEVLQLAAPEVVLS